jgi:hypothetical protein
VFLFDYSRPTVTIVNMVPPINGSPKRGRKPDANSKSGKIRSLLASGMSPGDIAKKVGCTPALVYNVRARAEGGGSSRKGKRGGRRGRPAGKGFDGGLSSLVDAVQATDRERTMLRSTLERIQTLIGQALG